MSQYDAIGPPECPEDRIADAIAAIVKQAVATEVCMIRSALGLQFDETFHDWLKRMQDEANRIREKAVAAEREACAQILQNWAHDDSESERDRKMFRYFAGLIRARSNP